MENIIVLKEKSERIYLIKGQAIHNDWTVSMPHCK